LQVRRLAAALAQVKIGPNTMADCYKVPNINTGLTIEYGSSCPGQGCFEDYPCRYVDSTAALTQMKFVPNTTAGCYKLPNINTGLTIEYDSSCPGQGCFEDYPCRYVDSASS